MYSAHGHYDMRCLTPLINHPGLLMYQQMLLQSIAVYSSNVLLLIQACTT